MYTEYYDFSNQINYNVTRDEREKPWHAAAAAGIMPARPPRKTSFLAFFVCILISAATTPVPLLLCCKYANASHKQYFHVDFKNKGTYAA